MGTSVRQRTGAFARARAWFTRPLRLARGPSADPSQSEDLTRAIADNLAQRLPLVFFVLIANIAVLSVRFAGTAPFMMTSTVPLLFCGLGLVRGIYWLPRFVRERELAVIHADLDRMRWTGAAIAICLTAWSLSLYAYGDLAQRSMVHYALTVSCYTAILGLAQSPRAAWMVTTLVMLPGTAFFIVLGHPNAIPIAMIEAMVTVMLISVTLGQHRDFVKLELARRRAGRREREAARLAETNHYNATIDPLTGALNRRAILAKLESGLSDCDNPQPWLALLDLDGFKHVNDTYGHGAGDEVLRAVSDRIEALPGVTSFGRLGGDEFAILLDGELDVDAARAALQALSEAVRQPVVHNGITLRLAGSIGLRRATFSTVNECLERSDAALYKAKEQGDGAVVLFTAEDERELNRKSADTRSFNDCPLEERLRLVYQPILDIDSGEVKGIEAFARWSPDGSLWLPPDQFLSLAQATGRTGELTRLVLVRALSECPVWKDGLELAINLSPRDVTRDGTPEALLEIVKQAGAPPERIMLEITERALHADPRRAGEQLARFRDLGFRIALDDFGAGWSSLSNVRNLPLDRIKIDRALASALADDPGARAIAGTIVGLAWQMGLECTIEGIEDERQADIARALGLRLMQGYRFGRPQPAAEIGQFLANAA